MILQLKGENFIIRLHPDEKKLFSNNLQFSKLLTCTQIMKR